MAGLNQTLNMAGLEVANATQTPIANHCSLLRWWSVGPEETILRGGLTSPSAVVASILRMVAFIRADQRKLSEPICWRSQITMAVKEAFHPRFDYQRKSFCIQTPVSTRADGNSRPQHRCVLEPDRAGISADCGLLADHELFLPPTLTSYNQSKQ